MAVCMHTGREPQFTYGHVHAQRQRARVYMWSCVCEGGMYRRRAKISAGEIVYMCIHRRGKQFTGRKPQFTCGHVHARRQEATVYMWSCAGTQAGSHSLHAVMCVWKRRVQVDDQQEGEGEDEDDSVVHHKHRPLHLQLLKRQPATVRYVPSVSCQCSMLQVQERGERNKIDF